MDIKGKIKKFIDQAGAIAAINSANKAALSRSGIADLTGNMPVEFNQWINSIKIFNDRYLTNHPLHTEISKVCFHNKCRHNDYKKMLGLLKALEDDEELESVVNLATTSNDVVGKADAVFDAVENYFHPLIKEISQKKLNDGHYADAVESAFKEINSRVKKLYIDIRGEEKDGADLMRKTFSPNDPALKFEDISSRSGKDVQQGYMDIFAGAMTGIRNPKAHENMVISKEDAVKRIVFASLLMDKIDEAVAFSSRTED